MEAGGDYPAMTYRELLRTMSDEVFRHEVATTLNHLAAAHLDADEDVVLELAARWDRRAP